VISARSFVRSQTLVGAALFAPLAWLAVDDAAFSPSTAILVAGASYLAATNATASRTFTVAERDLGRDGAFFGATAGWAMAYSFGASSRKAKALPALLGGIAGNVAGLWIGNGASDAEASGARIGGLAAGVAAAGVLGATRGLVQNGQLRRNAPAVLALGAAVGVPLGMRYVSHAPYRVTAGDLATYATTATLGAVAGGAVAASQRVRSGDGIAFALATGAGLGALAGDLLLVRPYDHTVGQGVTLLGGAAAGAGVAVLPYLLSGSRNTATVLTAMTVGGLVGTWGGLVVARPMTGERRVGAGREPEAAPTARTRGGVVLSVDPLGALYAAARIPGTFRLLSLGF
jgi:hypothetical protein